MSDDLVSVVVDCSKAGPPDPELAAHFDAAALELLRNGELEKAGKLMEEAKEILAASTVATESVVPLDADQVAQYAIDQAAGLEQHRAAAAAGVQAALAATDWWAARAYEDGVPLSKPRAAYRQKLRDLLTVIAAAADVAAVEAVALPKAPPAPSP